MGRSSIFLVLLLFAGSTLGAEHVIHAGRLVDVDAGKVLENMSVITSDEQIVAVQEGFVQAESGQKLIDLSQHVVLPGLMDMHTHITNVITPEFYSEQYTLGSGRLGITGNGLYGRYTHGRFYYYPRSWRPE